MVLRRLLGAGPGTLARSMVRESTSAVSGSGRWIVRGQKPPPVGRRRSAGQGRGRPVRPLSLPLAVSRPSPARPEVRARVAGHGCRVSEQPIPGSRVSFSAIPPRRVPVRAVDPCCSGSPGNGRRQLLGLTERPDLRGLLCGQLAWLLAALDLSLWTWWRISSTISGLARVLMSPTSAKLEIAAMTRRMIFPDRVFGMSCTIQTFLGRAILPISSLDRLLAPCPRSPCSAPRRA